MRAEAENREGKERSSRNSGGHRFMQSFLPGGLGRCLDLNVHAEQLGTFLFGDSPTLGLGGRFCISNQLLGAPGVWTLLGTVGFTSFLLALLDWVGAVSAVNQGHLLTADFPCGLLVLICCHPTSLTSRWVCKAGPLRRVTWLLSSWAAFLL